jgi:hypothetical protein
MEVSGQLHAPAALSPRKAPTAPIGNEVGCAPEPVWTTPKREDSCPYRDSNSDPSVVQPVASRYTDCAIPALATTTTTTTTTIIIIIIIIIVQFCIYLPAELNSQLPITELARIQTTTATKQHVTKQTKNMDQLRLFKLKHELLKISVDSQTAFAVDRHLNNNNNNSIQFNSFIYVLTQQP